MRIRLGNVGKRAWAEVSSGQHLDSMAFIESGEVARSN